MEKIENQKTVTAWMPNKAVQSPVICNDVIAYRLYMQLFKKPLDNRITNRTITTNLCDINWDNLIGSKYQRLHKALLNVVDMKMILKGKDDKSIEIINIFSKAKFVKGKRGVRSNNVEITINSDFLPYLKILYLGGLTKLSYKTINQLKRVPTVKIFQLIIWRSQFSKQFDLTIESIRCHLMLSNGEHKKWASLNQKVLAPAHKDINSTQVISYDYSPKKQNRGVVAISVVIKQVGIDENNYDPVVVNIVNEHIWEDHRERIINNYSPEHIKYYHSKCHKDAESGKIKNIDSFIFKSIVKDKDCFAKKIKKSEAEKNARIANRKKDMEKSKTEDAFFDFAEKCFYSMSKDEQEKYESSVKLGVGKTKTIFAIQLFIIDYKNELSKSNSIDDFNNILYCKTTMSPN
jgi:hypothetical protein